MTEITCIRAKQTSFEVQPTVTFPIGDHVNVLNDYKKMGTSKILKLLTCRCHHLIDMLFEFSQSLVLLTLLTLSMLDEKSYNSFIFANHIDC